MLYPYRNSIGTRYGRYLRMGMRTLQRYVPRRIPSPASAIGGAITAEAIRRALGSNKRVIPFSYSGRKYKRSRMMRSFGIGGCRARATRARFYKKGYPKYTAGHPLARKSDLRKVNVWHTERKISVGRIVSAINECVYDYKLVGSSSDVDALCQMVQATAALGEETIDLRQEDNAKMAVKGIGEVDIKNNTGLDIHITYYIVRYKANSSTNPSTLVTQGLTDYTSGAIANPETNVLFHADQSKDVSRYLQVIRKRKVCLEPGKELKVRYATPFIVYDPQDNDRSGTSYIAGYSTGVLFRVTGQVSHDQTTVANVGISSGVLDLVEKKFYRYGFISKSEVKQISVTENFATPPVQCVGANMEGQEAIDDPL